MQFIDEPSAEILLNCCGTAANSHVALLCSIFRTLQRRMDAVGDEVKRRSALHLERFARMVGQDKRRDMVWRFLAPPPFPRVIRPGATHRSEHVPTKNPRANVVHSSSRPLIVDTSRTTLLPVHLLPRPRGEEPLEQFRATHAERIVETLAWPSGVTIKRYSKRADADLGIPGILQSTENPERFVTILCI